MVEGEFFFDLEWNFLLSASSLAANKAPISPDFKWDPSLLWRWCCEEGVVVPFLPAHREVLHPSVIKQRNNCFIQILFKSKITKPIHFIVP